MFARSVLSSYYRLLAGLMLALMAIALAGCNEVVAEKAAPSRPVLISTVHIFSRGLHVPTFYCACAVDAKPSRCSITKMFNFHF